MSFILSQILKKKTPDWNSIIWTEETVQKNSVPHNVRLMEIPNHKVRGEYVIHYNQPFILIRKELKQGDKLWTILHEFGHHLIHTPVEHKFSKSILGRIDREANYFAAIAMMPTWLITSVSFEDIMDQYNVPHRLILIRREIWEAYRI